MTRERFAFDTTRCSDEKTTAVSLAALSIEARKGPIHKRIWPYRLVARGDGKITDPALGEERDIRTYYSTETELDQVETNTGIEFAQTLLEEEEGALAVWISPPTRGLYEEGRIQIGCVLKKGKVLQAYGIPADFPAEDYLKIGNDILEASLGNRPIKSTEQLRSTVIILSSGGEQDPWTLIRSKIPYGKEVWQTIESKIVEGHKRQALKDATEGITLVPRALYHRDPVLYGATLERFMRNRGYNIQSSPCGATNSDLINRRFTLNFFEIARDGSVKISQIKEGSGKNCILEPWKKCTGCGRCSKN